MRPLYFALVVLLAFAISGLSDRPASGARRSGSTFRVATFNIHKGADRSNRYDLQRTIQAIASLDADLVGLQEVLRNHPQFRCDDQAALIAEGLRRLTNRRWSYVFERSWITEDRECLERGWGDDVATEGLALFAPERIAASDRVRLHESRIGLLARVTPMPDVPVVVTHLAASRRNQSQRAQQVEELLPWARQRGPGILIGDLNARADAPELAPLLSRYRDAWRDAAASGLATGVTDGSTRPGGQSRIDFILYDPASGLELESVEIRDTSAEGLGEVSDHRPVIATFRRARATQSSSNAR
jgi:endonuclease/exonuclease/phosphatase family metal-dependent hydrolase